MEDRLCPEVALAVASYIPDINESEPSTSFNKYLDYFQTRNQYPYTLSRQTERLAETNM